MIEKTNTSRTALDGKPIKSLDIPAKQASEDSSIPPSPIPRRKKSVPQSNGHTNGNGTSTSLAVLENGSGKKRAAAEAFDGDTPSSKRSKIISNDADDGVIVLDDTDGAILIDDD
jgi:ubiquitin-like 1-activating enzyme E1 B